jgi:hypothetical protein
MTDDNLGSQIKKSSCSAVNKKQFLCACPNSKLGIVNLDISAHLPGCWIRKKLLTERFTVDTSVTQEINDGYCLGVAFRQ